MLAAFTTIVLSAIIISPVIVWFFRWGARRGREGVVPEWFIAVLVISAVAFESPITSAVGMAWFIGYTWGHRSKSKEARALGRQVRELRKAILQGEMVFHFQPIIDTSTSSNARRGNVVSAEVLVRRQHPDGRLEYPGPWLDVIQSDEELGGLFSDALWVEAEKFAAEWPNVRISINTMPERLAVPDMACDLLSRIEGAGLIPTQFIIEVVETALLKDTPVVRENLMRLHSAGTHIALDDFGTGESNVLRLTRFMEMVDTVKIDKELIQHPDRRSAATLVRLAQSFHKMVVAEGVETEEQAVWLRSIGVTQFQGWLYAKAMSQADFGSFIMQHGWGTWGATIGGDA